MNQPKGQDLDGTYTRLARLGNPDPVNMNAYAPRGGGDFR